MKRSIITIFLILLWIPGIVFAGIGDVEVKESEALIWHLGHSGWAIKTKNAFLIFDYVGQNPTPIEPSLSKGYISPSEIADQQVYVFISHSHLDHYDAKILNWATSINNITYILGWQKSLTVPKYVCMNPGETKTIGNIEVSTIRATDAGVGFVVKIDGLVIFHAGDHAYWSYAVGLQSFSREIDYINTIEPDIDFMFMPIAAGAGDMRQSIVDGVLYAIDKLGPNAMFPMHAGGKEYLYRTFSQQAGGHVYSAVKKGDLFLYKGKNIIIPGDINKDKLMDLHDLILAMKIIAGVNVGIPIDSDIDVNGDEKVGIAEALYILQKLGEIR